jgi:hypothetical protein
MFTISKNQILAPSKYILDCLSKTLGRFYLTVKEGSCRESINIDKSM